MIRHLSIRVGAAAAAVALAAGSAVVAQTPGASASSSSRVHLTDTTPRPKGTVTSITWDIVSGAPSTLDYVNSGTYSDTEIIENMCDDLLRLTPSFTIKPALATSWHYTNPTTLVFQIRKGVYFWNGQELTAQDVAYSLLRNEDKTLENLYGTYFTNVSSITATGQYQVTVNFKTPDELFLKNMATITGTIVEKSYVEQAGKNYGTPAGGVMCTGPYELTKWTASNEVVVKANPHYWTSAYKPKVKHIIFKWITTTSTLTSGLLSGEIDGAYAVPATAYSELESATDGKLYFGPALTGTVLAPTTGAGLIGNTKIRKALSLAINRQAIATNVYGGAAVPSLALMPPGSWSSIVKTWTASAKKIFATGYDKLQSVKPNIAEAKKLVQSVPDHSTPITLAFLSGTQTKLSLATAVQQAATEIGLHIKLDAVQPAQYVEISYTPNVRKGVDLFIFSAGPYLNTPLTYLINFFPKGPTAIYNYTTYTNPTVNKDLATALGTYKAVPLAKLLTKAQGIYMKSNIQIPVVSEDMTVFMNNEITGAPVSTAYVSEPCLAKLGATK